MNDLRAGKGRDSHHVLRRLFGIVGRADYEVIGGRQKIPGSGNRVSPKVTARMPHRQNLTLWYQRSEQDGVRGYKDLWGGLGRLRSDFEPQRLQFFYTRYEAPGRRAWTG